MVSSFTQAQEAAYKAGLVRVYRGSRVIGAGFYLGSGYLLTCAHVVIQGLGLNSKTDATEATAVAGQSIEVDFPFVAKGQRYSAEVVLDLWRSQGQDIAGLQLLAGVPDGVKPTTLVLSIDYYRDHDYCVLGFPEGHANGLEAKGKLLGELAQGWVQMEDEHTTGVAIEPGFSGAPVWDKQLGGVVGMTVARDRDRPEAKLGFMIPYKQLRSTLQAIEVLGLLKMFESYDDSILKTAVAQAYSIFDPRNPAQDYPTTLRDKLTSLQRMSQPSGSQSAIIQFIACLALPEAQLPDLLRSRLRQWLADRISQVDALLEAVKPFFLEKVQVAQQVLDSRLLFWVRDISNTENYSVQAFLVRDRQQYNLEQASGIEQLTALGKFKEALPQDQLSPAFFACLAEVREKKVNLTGLTIELFLPLKLLNQAVEWWEEDNDDNFCRPDPICVSHKINVRASDRFRKSVYSRQKDFWRQKWQCYQSRCQQSAVACLALCDDQTREAAIRQTSSRDIVGIRLSKAPASLDQRTSWLGVWFSSSAPVVAIWPRQELSRGNVATELETLLNSCLAELPERVKKTRIAALDQEQDAHLGHHLTFLLEDPDLIPYEVWRDNGV